MEDLGPTPSSGVYQSSAIQNQELDQVVKTGGFKKLKQQIFAKVWAELSGASEDVKSLENIQ